MKLSRVTAGCVSAMLVGLALSGCSRSGAPAPRAPDPASALSHSIAIVRSATAERPRVLKVMFYGQSISVPKWTDQATASLRARYPHVVFDVRNYALGGWAADLLERAAQRDVDEFYPDLIVFHVYGDHHAYERIIRTFRSRTAADVVVQTDHVVDPVEPLCDEGFHLQWSPPPGCKGHLLFRQSVWEEYMSGVWIPTMAQKYGLAVDPRRQQWDAYLKAHHLQPMALIADVPHPNAQGWAVMASLFTQWFEGVIEHGGSPPPLFADAVRSYAPPAGGDTRRYRFTGNRIELLGVGPLAGKIKVAIDGKAPEAVDGCWQNSRVSGLPNLPAWPGLKQVTARPGDHEADRWTLTMTGFDAAQDNFMFTLTSARHGPDGQGKADARFTSPSGRIAIDPGDWNLSYAKEVVGHGVGEGTRLTWERHFVCTDQPAVALGNGRAEHRFVLATGLDNAEHTVDLTVAADAPAITEVRSYRPALR